MKYTLKEYTFICSLIWGGAPVDRQWAEGTKIFIEEAPKIMQKYPHLDTDFYKKA